MERIEKLLSFLEQSPKDDFLRHALALEYIKANELQKAKELFETLLTENPHYTGSYYHLAKLYQSLNQNEKAIACYIKGMETAHQAGHTHTFNELKAAYEEFTL